MLDLISAQSFPPERNPFDKSDAVLDLLGKFGRRRHAPQAEECKFLLLGWRLVAHGDTCLDMNYHILQHVLQHSTGYLNTLSARLFHIHSDTLSVT